MHASAPRVNECLEWRLPLHLFESCMFDLLDAELINDYSTMATAKEGFQRRKSMQVDDSRASQLASKALMGFNTK